MSSSSSSTSRYGPLVATNRSEMCFCPHLAQLRESKKDDNPHRRFFNCPRSLVSPDSCNFFKWYDPPLNDHYKKAVLELKRKIRELGEDGEVGRLHKKVEKHKNARLYEKQFSDTRIKELEAQVAHLQWQNKKYLLMVYGLCLIVLLLVCLMVYLKVKG